MRTGAQGEQAHVSAGLHGSPHTWAPFEIVPLLTTCVNPKHKQTAIRTVVLVSQLGYNTSTELR